MEWINKEKLTFVVAIVLLIYATLSLVGTRSPIITEPEPPQPLDVDERYGIPWETQPSLIKVHFGDVYTGERDPFVEPSSVIIVGPGTIILKKPPLLSSPGLMPVPSFIGAEPLVQKSPDLQNSGKEGSQ